MALLNDAIAVRDKALAEVQALPAYLMLKALDEAVVAGGGTSVLLPTPTERLVQTVRDVASRRKQADYAYDALEANGEPMPIGSLLKATLAQGAVINGVQLANIRSTLSRDPRFASVMRGGVYYWWFSDRPLPSHWNEPGADLPAETPGTSVSSNQETADAENNT